MRTLDIIPLNGKNASDPSATSVSFVQPFPLIFVNTSGFLFEDCLPASCLQHRPCNRLPYRDRSHCLCLHRLIPSTNGRFITCGDCLRPPPSALASCKTCNNLDLDCCPAPIPIACPSLSTKHTELDCVYFNVIIEIARSILACSSAVLCSPVTIFEKKSSSIFNSFLSLLKCNTVYPLVFDWSQVHNPDRSGLHCSFLFLCFKISALPVHIQERSHHRILHV